MLHPVLRRQLRRLGIDEEAGPAGPDDWRALLERVSRAYTEADQDRYTLERSLSISSRELRQLYEDLRRSSETELAVGYERLEKSHALIRATQEAAIDGILVLDETLAVAGYNSRFAQMWRVPPDVLEDRDDERLVAHVLSSVADPGSLEGRLRYLEGHPADSSRDEIRLGDGRVFDAYSAPMASLTGQSYGRVWFFRDVTEEKRAEERLRQVNRFLDSVIENIPSMIFVKEAESLRYLRLNRAAEQLFGRPPGEILGRNDHDLFPPEQAASFAREDREAIARGGLVTEAPVQTRLHGERILHTKKLPIADETGRARYLLCISEDITLEQRAQAELRQAKEAAEAASRTKSDFLSNMSHELRTPLSSILGFGRVLQHAAFGPLNERQSTYLQHIVRASEHMLNLVNDLLDLRRVTDGHWALELESVDVALVVEEAVQLVRPLLDERGHTLASAAGEVPRVLANRRALVQVLVNLLSNAVKYTPPGGTIEVGARRLDERLVAVWVRDNGIGIAPEDQARLFHYFEQIGGKHAHHMHGTGIGLALTRALVEKLGGTVAVDSAPGVGSTFTFSIPVAVSASDARAGESAGGTARGFAPALASSSTR